MMVPLTGSITELEIMYVRYLDQRGTPVSNFLRIIDVEHAHADGIYSAINKAFLDVGMPNWKEKLVWAGSDGANVNIGVNNRVATRMCDEEHPYILTVHCVAHRLDINGHPLALDYQNSHSDNQICFTTCLTDCQHFSEKNSN